ncbi:hypothetical protein SAMN05421821_104100 [Mucilaginibacter lappiensis]|uniref:Uncharacterized protein n=1 Tax=Mucilaginibacter lappiensis TaxID=354630 RepID=A0ABR6PI89_9SPHI|nr:DUF5908 family protein [Mucilaginibacter lappiensis]MBB6109487.1 hypothetical protein [Mucilaginibacter lappiensis]SIQ93387.1 hypothetical protein SAMN05421821_104100 [Mucilaginibacter lappiensis]
MPVEIRELQITTIITEGGNTGASTPSSSPAATGGEDIIAKCVEQVLEILKEKTDR